MNDNHKCQQFQTPKASALFRQVERVCWIIRNGMVLEVQVAYTLIMCLRNSNFISPTRADAIVVYTLHTNSKFRIIRRRKMKKRRRRPWIKRSSISELSRTNFICSMGGYEFRSRICTPRSPPTSEGERRKRLDFSATLTPTIIFIYLLIVHGYCSRAIQIKRRTTKKIENVK